MSNNAHYFNLGNYFCIVSYVIVIIVITINSHFHLGEIRLHHITILVNQNDIIEHAIKVTITVA